MVASARVAYLARRSAEYGVHAGPLSVDLRAVRGRKQRIVEGARHGYESRMLEVRGVDLLKGEARFIAPRTLAVSLKNSETREIGAPLMLIDTGSRPAPLAIKGVEHVPVLNSTTIMELDTVREPCSSSAAAISASSLDRCFAVLGVRSRSFSTVRAC